MYDFQNFGQTQMIEASKGLRHLARRSDSMEEAAAEVVEFLFRSFQMGDAGEPACALVRCFKTERYGALPEDLKEAARSGLQEMEATDEMPCLTLLASRGVEPAWNGRHGSQGHRSIPLATPAMVAEAPMIARLIEQMGLGTENLVKEEDPEKLVALERRPMNVFHVIEARRSKFVPAQEGFVIPYGVRSVLGFGGVLPGGEIYCVLMFSRVRILEETADMFPTLGLGVKMALQGHVGRKIFVG